MRGPLTDEERLERIKELWDAEDLNGLAQLARHLVAGQRAALQQMEEAQKAAAMAMAAQERLLRQVVALERACDAGFPRRASVERWTPAESAIRTAQRAVEEAGAHVLLTEAIVLLDQAFGKVADHTDLQASTGQSE